MDFLETIYFKEFATFASLEKLKVMKFSFRKNNIKKTKIVLQKWLKGGIIVL